MGNYFGYSQKEIKETKIKRVYGWKKDKSDSRDMIHDFIIPHYHDNIKECDLRSKCPEIYDQLNLGSCTANAIAAAYEFDEMKQYEQHIFTPSRLFIYYNERSMEGTINEDSGAQIRDGIKSISVTGVCPEQMWPYDVSKFKEKPPEDCYQEAGWHQAVRYKKVKQNLKQMRQCLVEGLPFVFGFTVFESFESKEVAETGIMPLPKKGETILGGHAVMAVGFNNEKKSCLIRNSWGTSFGLNGYFWMPYEFILNPDYCSDFWTIERVVDTD